MADDGDEDLKRAKDLCELHTTVKLAHQDGPNKELHEARETVNDVISELARA
ncbi:hypothetical protein K470DRAFT_255144 [Piedraia hortae CBS 480.64]|uniref:Uncharacterized protein n=1 Tax=Piedraia hortae CBS 480.64 TaxID=1314780 RepID=A0A6A7C7F2_9PEZI|nr:hypothetical protein K470DRAFT_255144 [Piedraia hortae CBS 480.64]